MAEGSGGAGRCGDDRRAPLHVLLAEDSLVNQRVTQLLLGRLGHAVDTVSDGFEAVAAVARTSYDVVLMDLQMPGLDGLAASQLIQEATSGSRRPPVVALTASGSAEDRVACRAAGMDAFLTKPLTLEALGAALSGVLPAGSGADPDADTRSHAAGATGPASPAGDDTGIAMRQELIERRLDELTGPRPEDEDLDDFSRILRSFVDRSPSLVDDLADAVRHGTVAAVEHQAHKLKGSAANLGGADLAGLLDHIESQSRLGLPTTSSDLEPVRAELAELRRSLAAVAGSLDSRPRTGEPEPR